jgi:hypothetical protein
MNGNSNSHNGGHTVNGISPAVTAFLREHVSSIEILEVLLLFHADPARAWTADAVAAELRLQPRSVEARCAALLRIGLLVADAKGDAKSTPSFRFASGALAAAVVDELASTYRTRRVSVIELIFSKPPADAPRAFADAFVIRKGDRDG